EILADLLHAPFRAAERVAGVDKVVGLPQLLAELDRRRKAGQRVAFTNGCFDVLHAGHVQYLAEARRQADCLVVGVNSDSSVRQLKGPGRPLNPVEARALVLASLQDVDYVTIFAEPTPLTLIKAVRPDVLVKGGDYRKAEVVGAEFVESYGGRVRLAQLRDGFSATGLIERMKAAGREVGPASRAGRTRSNGSRMNRIALFLPNWVGDVVMATPAVRAVRTAFPAAELVAVCK